VCSASCSGYLRLRSILVEASRYFFPAIAVYSLNRIRLQRNRQSGGAAYALQPTTSIPIERAVPSMVLIAPSRSLELRSLTLVLAISSTCARVTLPTLFLFGVAEPLATPLALISSTEAGGLLVMKVKERSANTVTITGIISPCMFWVWAL